MVAEGLKVALQDGILVLTLANPPGNALTPGLRTALLDQITTTTARGIVIEAEGPAFSNHQPIDPDAAAPSLAALCQAVADSPVPIVVALSGRVAGPGAELALAARARLSDPTLRLAFADVTLGLCPAGGASQRLPRLVGAGAALPLLLTGRAVAASEALTIRLIDGITDGPPRPAALRLAAALAAGDILPRPTPDPVAWQAAVATARRDLGRPLPAGPRIIDCVEAALLLPGASGFAFEAMARADLEATPEAAGLRAAAHAERQAMALPTVLARLRPLSVDRIGLVGIAPDLARLAVAALSRDIEVGWVFATEAERSAGFAAIDAGISEGTRTGHLTASRARQMTGRLLAGDGPEVLTTAAMVVHGDEGPEPAGHPVIPGAAHLVLGGRAGEIGLALSPAGRACELVLPADVDPLARATAFAGVRRIGLSPVVVGRRAVLGARMADAGRTALAWMISHGVPRRLVMTALDGFGVRVMDSVSAEAPSILRAMPLAEVLQRWLAALANEGARLLDEGIAQRPSDIDHLMVMGLEFPRWQGGPMHQADRRGLLALRADLRIWGTEAALWSPAPLIDRLIRDGQSFASRTADRS